MSERRNSAGIPLNRIPTVQEDSEDYESAHMPWRAQTAPNATPPRRSDTNNSSSTYSYREREGSANSLPPAFRRDSLAPSFLSARAPQSPMSEDSSGKTLGGSPGHLTPEVFEDEDEIGTEDKLKDFHKVELSNLVVDAGSVSRKQARLDAHRKANEAHRPTLKALREWAAYDEPDEDALLGEFRRSLPWNKRPTLPNNDKLLSLAHHYYKPIGEIRIDICDFGPNRAEHTVSTLGEVQQAWSEKPEWATVRWIHAPLGVGLTHSSVEDLFLHGGPKEGRPFKNGGSHGWPYLVAQVLNIRSKDQFQDMRDVCVLMKNKIPALSALLDKGTFAGDNNPRLKQDIVWRANHLGTTSRFWDLAQSNMSWQLPEGLNLGMEGPHSGLKAISHKLDEQLLSRHPFYKESQLVRDPFRCFHRADGCLLTLGPMGGVNFLERRHSEFLQENPADIFDNKDASALGAVWQAFSKTGTLTWHRDTVEWFLVYLMTEIEATPHTISQGHNAPSLAQAYRVIAEDLKRRRFDRWKRNESIKLVQDYITCADELSLIVDAFAKKLDFLNRLRKDCELFEQEDQFAPNNSNGKTSLVRIDWAIGVVEEAFDVLDSLLKDLRLSMSALFQLRSIEQNELAIVADSQNKAILVFTGVTIVFLPLSFFTSYFGMNLKGIANSDKTEGYFWYVCGTVGLFLVLSTIIIAFRHKLQSLFSKSKRRQLEAGEV